MPIDTALRPSRFRSDKSISDPAMNRKNNISSLIEASRTILALADDWNNH
jgi:hypothetical protein